MDIMTIQGVRGYIDAFGTIHLNAEDVARGLGFVQVEEKVSTTSGRKTYETVRWARVNGYLAEFGYGKEVAKDDFIPENMFYRLAMKASNETAQAFQAKVADEILPTIRRTGFYAITPKAPTPAADIVTDVGATAEAIQALFAVKRGIALAQAIDIVSELKSFDGIGRLKELLPPAEHETGFLNATQIGEKIGLNARRVNPLIEKAGLQVKEGKQWRLTEAGKSYVTPDPINCSTSITRTQSIGREIKLGDRVRIVAQELQKAFAYARIGLTSPTSTEKASHDIYSEPKMAPQIHNWTKS